MNTKNIIALCTTGCPIPAGFPHKAAAQIALKVTREWLEKHRDKVMVTLVFHPHLTSEETQTSHRWTGSSSVCFRKWTINSTVNIFTIFIQLRNVLLSLTKRKVLVYTEGQGIYLCKISSTFSQKLQRSQRESCLGHH